MARRWPVVSNPQKERKEQEQDPEQSQMFAKLEEYRQLLIAGYASWEGRGETLPKAEQIELLRSLGYIE